MGMGLEIDAAGSMKKRWTKDTRFYEIHLHRDLWGTWILTRVWGGIDSARGRVVHTPYSTRDECEREILNVERCRRRRGYRETYG